MAADIYTKGFNDIGLFNRLLLLTNLYSPEQWRQNILRPTPILGDKTLAIGTEDFDDMLVNSQWSILTGGPSTKQEDNRKPIKKKAKPKKMASYGGVLCPKLGSSDNAYRIDLGVLCFQLPPDAPDGSSRLNSMRFRHTWCITQRVMWLDEKFDTRSEDEALLATCNISYLTRKLSASRKFDLATFFYFGELPEEHDKLEWSIVRKYNASRCLPPTLDTLVPRYLVVFVDILGSRKGTFQIPPSWSCLERAVLTTLSAAGSARDCSYIIATSEKIMITL